MTDRILLLEDTEKIQWFEAELKAKINRCKNLLNELAKVYKFENPEGIPTDADSVIWKIYLTRNREAAKRVEYEKGFNINSVVMPSDLQELRAALWNWNRFDAKDAVIYLQKVGNEYVENSELIDRELQRYNETQRIYSTNEEMNLRFTDCTNVLTAVYNFAKFKGIDFKTDSLNVVSIRNQIQKSNPFIRWKSFPVNEFRINTDYVLTGKF